MIPREITITVKPPIDCTNEQFEEWIKFSVGYTCQMSADNPLAEYSLETDYISF